MDLIVARPQGLYCPPGDFYIDPWRPVARAVITHAHADHARVGHARYLGAAPGAGLLRARLGADIRLDTLAYGEALQVGDARVSLHPAGHILGSAQVRVEHRGEVWVVSGDYKTDPDGTCAPFEPVRCHAFVSESTFGLPVYRWGPQAEWAQAIRHWWAANAAEGRASVLYCYALGKAQRLLQQLADGPGPILTHGAVEAVTELYRAAGVALPPTAPAAQSGAEPARALVLAPPSARGTPWLRRFGPHADAFASGWMQIRGARRRRGVDRGFVVSDHADWNGLCAAIGATGAERVYLTHGNTAALQRWLIEQGLDARTFHTEFGDEDDEAAPAGGGRMSPGARAGLAAFAELYAALDATTSTHARRAALEAYFGSAPAEDAAWAVYFLAGGKPRQLVPVRVLRAFAQAEAGVPDWLFEACYQHVGDLAETIALLVPGQPGVRVEGGLAEWMHERLLPLRGMADEALARSLSESFARLDAQGRFVFAKLITGALRVGVSRLTVTRALSAVAGVDAHRIAQRLVGYTDRMATPDAAAYRALVAGEGERDAAGAGHPYPFFLAHPLQIPLETFDTQLGAPADWLIEWKWDGIRAQVVQRDGRAWVWSRGEELVTDRFPELAAMAEALPYGTVLDGEILVWEDGRVQPFARLQRRLGRKTVSAKLLREHPVVLLAYDLLEEGGVDLRGLPQAERRSRLEALVAALGHPQLVLSPRLQGADWTTLAELRSRSRELGVEGLMLKQASARYGVGRTRASGVWWKWKIDPLAVDAVLIYAQPGHGRRANLYTDYTFAVWDAPPGAPQRQLVPFAKAYSGLTDEEIRRVDHFVRRNTVERFGPVRSVRPELVFEIGFEGIAASPRHKSGVAVRFPRMLRWRHDKPVEEVDTLADLERLARP